MDRQTRLNAEGNMDSGNRILMLTLTADDPTYQMKPGDNVVHAVSTAGDGVAIITLPSVAEAAGQLYIIVATTGAAGGDISLHLKETGAEGYDMDADDDHIGLLSDGVNWRSVVAGIA